MEKGSLSFANIIIDISHEKVDRPFQYIIPDRLRDKVFVGTSVSIPFGKGNTLRKGYVIGITDLPEFDPARTKEITDIAEDQVSAEGIMVRLAAWMHRTYGSTMINALRTVIPVRKKSKTLMHRYISLNMSVEEAKSLLEHTNYSIMEIAVACGYSDQSYFTKVFKKSTGITPKQYR